MSRRVWVALVFVVVAATAVAWFIAPASTEGYADGVAVIAFAALLATGIERALEVFWSLVGGSRSLGQWWPFCVFADAMAELEKETEKTVGPAIDDAVKALKDLKATASADKAAALKSRLELLETDAAAFKAQLVKAQALAPGSGRVTLVTGAAAQGLSAASSAISGIGDGADTVSKKLREADNAATLAAQVLESFQDNPARRIMSILLGVSVGLLAAAFVGLNLFTAVLGTPGDGKTYASLPVLGDLTVATLGVLLTGLVIGLGSSPTHELVKALQNYKARKTLPPSEPATVIVESASPPASHVALQEKVITRVVHEQQSTGLSRLLGIRAPAHEREVVTYVETVPREQTAVPPSSLGPPRAAVGSRLSAVRYRRTS